MEKVVVDAEGRVKLNGMDRELVLANAAGRTVGYFVPPDEYNRMVLALLSTEPTAEELEASRKEYREKGGWTTAQVLEHLAEVKRQWEAENQK